MGWTLKAHIGAALGVNGGTTAAIDTTGADLLLIALTYQGAAAPTFSDSKSNAAPTSIISAQNTNSNFTVALWYIPTPIVGTGHTFTLTRTGSFCSVAVQAWSGSSGSGTLDQSNGNASALFGTTVQPGAVTPGASGELLVTAVEADVLAGMSIGAGFTISDQIGFLSGTAEGIGMAYLVASGSLPTNPTWTSSLPADLAAVIATFTPSTASPFAMSGSGTSAWTGQATISRTVALGGSGTAALTGAARAPASAALSGSGTAAFTGAARARAALALEGSGTAAWTGAARDSGTAALAGSGTAAFTGAARARAALALEGSGTAAWTGAARDSGTAALAGSGTAHWTGAIVGVGTAALTGSGTAAWKGAFGAHVAWHGSGHAIWRGTVRPAQLCGVLTDAAKLLLLGWVRPVFGTFQLALIADGPTPGQEVLWSDLTECAFTGYTRMPVLHVGAVQLDGFGHAFMTARTQRWVNFGDSPVSVIGWAYVTAETPTRLMSYGRYPSARLVLPLAAYQLTPSMDDTGLACP
jgi:hypothetical protein